MKKLQKFVALVVVMLMVLAVAPVAFASECDDLGHAWGEWQITKPATCTEKGIKRQVCTRCDAVSEIVYIPETGHDWGEWQTTLAPTCTNKGVKRRVCTRCNAVSEPVYTPETGHTWGEWQTTLAPTCTTAGVKRQVCTRCDAVSDSETIPAKGHDMSGEKILTAPTCDSAGTKEIVCTRCGHSDGETQSIDKLGHDWSGWNITKAATCTEQGEMRKTCNRCNVVSGPSYFPAKGHDMSDEKILTAPTCDSAGTKEIACTRCDYSETQSIPALGHDWSEWTIIKEPTCTEHGVRMRKCQRRNCDYDICDQYEWITELGHDLVHHEAKEPTYDDIGWYEYDECTRGDYTTYVERPKLVRPVVVEETKSSKPKENKKPSSKNCLVVDWSYNDGEVKGEKLLISNYRLGLEQRVILNDKLKGEKVICRIYNDTEHTVNVGLFVAEDAKKAWNVIEEDEKLFEDYCTILLKPGDEYFFTLTDAEIGKVLMPNEYDEELTPKRSDAYKDVIVIIDSNEILEIKKK